MKCTLLHAQLDFWHSQIRPYQSLAVLYSAVYSNQLYFVLFVSVCHMTLYCIYPKCGFPPCRLHNGRLVSNKLQWWILKAIHQWWI